MLRSRACRQTVLEAAKQFNQASEAFEVAWEMLMDDWEVPEDFKFWDYVALLRGQIESLRCRDSLKFALVPGVLEFYRLALVQPEVYDIEAGISLAVGWTEVRDQLYEACQNLVEDKSDDSYSDLCDSLPFAGQEFVEDVLSGEIDDAKTFRAELRRQLLTEDWFNFVYDGENYVASTLEDQAKRIFLINVGDDDPVTLTAGLLAHNETD